MSYSLIGKFNGFMGPEPHSRTTQSWTNNPKCCGSGTYWPYSCELAEFKYSPQPGGKTDLSLYHPSDTRTPFLTLKGIWYGPSWLAIPFPPTKGWAPGFFRWFTQDITTTTKTTADGKVVKIGNGLFNWNFGDFKIGLCGVDSLEGPARANLTGEFIPLGLGTNDATTLYIQNVPYV
jgi:hypothetical protein